MLVSIHSLQVRERPLGRWKACVPLCPLMTLKASKQYSILVLQRKHRRRQPADYFDTLPRLWQAGRLARLIQQVYRRCDGKCLCTSVYKAFPPPRRPRLCCWTASSWASCSAASATPSSARAPSSYRTAPASRGGTASSNCEWRRRSIACVCLCNVQRQGIAAYHGVDSLFPFYLCTASGTFAVAACEALCCLLSRALDCTLSSGPTVRSLQRSACRVHGPQLGQRIGFVSI